ncbi:hypothetical protein [uncultured Brevundimonas sp.]|uniref:hypothetical protein n=1 Tax=uncultured Brevundimonas sp. TaxID=213418 RepID=UPI002639A93D|nr:hypothetical protein [uncultured Brevundimonas sp.]
MRIVSILIGVAVGAYITWKAVSPLPESPTPCLDGTGCAGPPVRIASLEAHRPGLQIALYDPAMEPERLYATEEPHPAWTSSAEAEPAGRSPGARFGSMSAGLRQAVDFKLAPLGRPGSHGLCLVPEDGKRRCVALIAAPQE